MTINCSMFSFFFRMTLLPTVIVLFKVFICIFIQFLFFRLNYQLLAKHYHAGNADNMRSQKKKTVTNTLTIVDIYLLLPCFRYVYLNILVLSLQVFCLFLIILALGSVLTKNEGIIKQNKYHEEFLFDTRINDNPKPSLFSRLKRLLMTWLIM